MKNRYNLKNEEDRKELTHYALDLDADELLAERDRMFKLGYREHIDDNDVIMFYWFGQNVYDTFLHGLFEYNLAEAEYLNISIANPHYSPIMHKNKLISQMNIFSFLPEVVTGRKLNCAEVMPRTAIKSDIIRKWNQPEYKDLRSKLELMVKG